jgi:arylsulfatase A-like enzyme
MNILLLTADSLRCDRTSLFGHTRDTTPFLSDLAARGFEFRRAYANGRNTAASFPAIHTSTHQRYYNGIGIPESGTPTLAEMIRENGYRTHAIHTNELISRDYNYNRGFDVYHDSRSDGGGIGGWRSKARDLIGDGRLFELVKKVHFTATEHLGLKIFDTADAVSGFKDRILEWTTGTNEDWFVWAHYMNPHHPYEPSVNCQEALGLDPVPMRQATRLSRKMRIHPENLNHEERKMISDLYDASVLSWDREIESTYRQLEKAGELGDTLVIVTSDHGELLGEDGIYGHPSVLNQPLLRVPLVFSGGSVNAGETDTQVELRDLAPTILTLGGQPVPNNYDGRPLFDTDGNRRTTDSRLLIAEAGSKGEDPICAVDGNRKAVYNPKIDNCKFYNLTTDALGERPTDDEYDDLCENIRDHHERTARNRTEGADVDESSLREDLAALGYLDE